MAGRAKVPDLGPRMPLAEAARRLIVARLADVRAQEAEVLVEAPAHEAVHDTRVAVRRLVAALRLLGDGRLRALAKEVRALKDALGPVRDLHVQGAWLSSHDPALARRHAERERGQLGRLHAAVRRFRRSVAPKLAAATAELDREGRFGGPKLRKRLRRELQRMDERTRAALDDFTPGTIHRVRIAAKKLRYALELVRKAVGPAGDALRLLESLQAKLGGLHDLDARLALLLELDAPLKLTSQVQRERDAAAPPARAALRRWRKAKPIRRLRRAL